MIYITDTKQTLELEKKAVVEQKLLIEQLMDRAGYSLADEVLRFEPKGLVVIVCGKGNNAGDGFVAARYLNKKNIAVKVLALYKPEELSKEAFKAYERLPKALIENGQKSLSILNKAQIIVDAIFGFSFKPPLRTYELKVVKQINKQRALVISADVPSGTPASTGFVKGDEAVEADKTVCFSTIKKGLLTDKGPNFAGEIVVADIGVSSQIIRRYQSVSALDGEAAKALLPLRKPLTHKKAVGSVLVVAGSTDYTGAPIMTAEAALRAGAGYVLLAVPQEIRAVIQQKIAPEVIVKGLPSVSGVFSKEAAGELLELTKEFDCLAIGPGVTTKKPALDFVASLLAKIKNPCVVDADGLTAMIGLSNNEARTTNNELILTPHAGELSRLTGLSVEEIEKDRFKAAKKLASASSNVTVLLKGRYSIVATKDELLANLTSNPGMATAGTGDVLAGVIAAFVAQGLKPRDATALGAFIHGLAGDIAAHELSEYSLMATDLIEYLPEAFVELMNNG